MTTLTSEQRDGSVMFHRWLTQDLVAQAERAAFATCRCTYCGARCFGRTCPSHRDLPALERQQVAC